MQQLPRVWQRQRHLQQQEAPIVNLDEDDEQEMVDAGPGITAPSTPVSKRSAPYAATSRAMAARATSSGPPTTQGRQQHQQQKSKAPNEDGQNDTSVLQIAPAFLATVASVSGRVHSGASAAASCVSSSRSRSVFRRSRNRRACHMLAMAILLNP